MLTLSILGYGAVGLSIGSLLINANSKEARIIFYSPNRNINPSPLFTVLHDNESTKIDSSFFNECEVVRQTDVVLVCLKLYDLESFSRQLLEEIPKTATVLMLSNGIENSSRFKDLVPTSNVIEGLLYISCIKVGDQVTNYTLNPRIIIDSSSKNNYILESNEFRTLFNKAGIKIEYSKQFKWESWRKLIITSSINGACIFYESTPSNIFSSQEKSNFLRSLLHEGIEVAKSLELKFDAIKIDEMYKDILSMPQECIPSMFWDYLKNKPLEIDFLNSKIISHGREKRIATPLNSAIVEKINHSKHFSRT